MSGLAGQPVQPMRGTKQIRLVLQKDWLQASAHKDQGGRLEVGDKGYVVGLERGHFHQEGPVRSPAELRPHVGMR